MPLRIWAENAKFRSFLIKILRGGRVGPSLPDNLWQRGDDAFRQCREAAQTVSHKKAEKAQNELKKPGLP
jgi:hypothetical protein